MARTVDNLGSDLSQDYARRQEDLATSPIRKAPTVSSQVEVSVLRPVFSNEIDELLDAQRTSTLWALISPPEGFYEASKDSLVFSGPPVVVAEALETRKQKLLDTPPQPDDNPEEHAKAKETLVKFMGNLELRHDLSMETNAKGLQYRKA